MMEPRDLVGYAPGQPQGSWPNGAFLALNIALNVEEGSERSPLEGDSANEGLSEVPRTLSPGVRDLATESVYEYGSRVGALRLLRLFDRIGVEITVFAAAQALERNAPVAEAIALSPHEVCAHGYRWTEAWTMDGEQEREAIARAVASIEASVGKRPVGWYSRWMRSERTRRLLVEEGGFIYDSDAYNDDTPYYVKVGSADHLVVPYSLTYNDAQYSYGHLASPSDFTDLTVRAASYMLAEDDGVPRLLSIGLHPRLSGQPGRASAVEETVDRILGLGNVWIATRRQIAEFWLREHPAK